MIEAIEIITPNLLVLLGWFVIYKQTVSIKKRDDVEVIINKSCELIERIYDNTIIYFSNDDIEFRGHESAEIRSMSLLLSHYFILLKERGIEMPVSQQLNAFRSCCMGGYFENSEKANQRKIPDWKSDLSNSKSELIFRVNQCFLNWCHPKRRGK